MYTFSQLVAAVVACELTFFLVTILFSWGTESKRRKRAKKTADRLKQSKITLDDVNDRPEFFVGRTAKESARIIEGLAYIESEHSKHQLYIKFGRIPYNEVLDIIFELRVLDFGIEEIKTEDGYAARIVWVKSWG